MINTDDQTVYIALRLTDGYLARKLGKGSAARIVPQERDARNIELNNTGVRPAFRDLAAIDRSSFGFNITNFGECGETVRITRGIEEHKLLPAPAVCKADSQARCRTPCQGVQSPEAMGRYSATIRPA